MDKVDKVKSFSGYYGVLLILCGVVGIIVSLFNTSPGLNVPSIVVTAVFFGVGAVVILLSIYDNKKLKRLKRMGQAHPAVKATIRPIYLMRGDSARRGTYHGFRVECEFYDKGGKLRTVKSKSLAVFKNETRMISHDGPLAVSATIYVNPSKPKDYAIGVEIA